jgi:CBS domain-containing protein
MSLRNIMVAKEDLFILGQDQSVLTAVKEMAVLNIGVTIIKNEKEELIGIFSERDLLKRVVPKNLDPALTTLQQVMTHPLVTIPVGTTPMSCLEVLKKFNIRHLPVRDDKEEIIGLIGIRDLMNSLIKALADNNNKLRQELDQLSFL